MISIVAYIRPHQLEAVKSALSAIGVAGLTVADVRGRGSGAERPRWSAGGGQISAFPVRSRIELVVDESLKDTIIEAIITNSVTGEPGDGKIFISKVSGAIRVRTGESGEAAL